MVTEAKHEDNSTFGAMSCTTTLSCTDRVLVEIALERYPELMSTFRKIGERTFLAALRQHLLAGQSAVSLPSLANGRVLQRAAPPLLVEQQTSLQAF